jgi:iron complex transport system ATP-binding protein
VSEVLRLDDVSVAYRHGEPVVSGVGLTVSEGEVLGLVGPNGAGKTTLLRAVTGGAEVVAGRVTLLGRPLASYTSRDLARNVAVLPQTPPQTFAFTARRYVELGRHPHLGRLSDLEARDVRAVDRAMELTDTTRLTGSPVDTLSGGDLQRLTLAQALAQGPRLLLLDEPTSHLDLDHALQVLDLVRRLAAEGLSVVAVFHDLGLAARYSDRLGVVADGRLAAIGPPASVLTADTLRDVFRVRAVVGTDAVTGTVSVTPVLRDAAVTRAPGRGRVLVVCGASSGAALLRRLVLEGWDVSCAALNRGDTDQAVASALDLPRVELPPFGPVDAAAEERVGEMAASADAVVVAPTPFGVGNLGNLRAAVRHAARTIVVETDAERDFAGGEAARLLEEARARGAETVAEDRVPETLERLVGR